METNTEKAVRQIEERDAEKRRVLEAVREYASPLFARRSIWDVKRMTIHHFCEMNRKFSRADVHWALNIITHRVNQF